MPGFALSTLGKHEARRVGQAIAKRPTRVSLIATSPLLRAVQTAVEISQQCGGPSVLTMPGLGEWMLTNRWAGRTWNWIKRYRKKEWTTYIRHPAHVAFAEESLDEVVKRMLASIDLAWREALRRASFAKGGALRCSSQDVPLRRRIAEESVAFAEEQSEQLRSASGLALSRESVAFCVVSHADPLKAALLALTEKDLNSLHSVDFPVGSCLEVQLVRSVEGKIRAEGIKRLI